MATIAADQSTAKFFTVASDLCIRIVENSKFFAALLLIAIAAQLLASSYQLPMGGHSDEPAHFLGSVMVRDYLLAGLPSPPMAMPNNTMRITRPSRSAIGRRCFISWLEPGWFCSESLTSQLCC